MFNPNEFRVSEEEITKLTSRCLDMLRNAFEMYSTDPSYVEREDTVYACDIDYDMANDFNVTRDFMEKFMGKDPNYIPSMKFAMDIIQATDLGAKAFGFIDIPDKIVEEKIDNNQSTSKTISGIEAIIYCIEQIPEDDKTQVKKRIAELFSLDPTSLYDDLLAIPILDLTKFPVTKVLELTLLIGLPIQALFKYNFYNLCERI